MIIQKQWRILTVGDGDLSFSLAIYNKFKPQNLIASVYDSENQLRKKYENNALDELRKHNITTYTEFDVTKSVNWQQIPKDSIDLVIFQFPLIPAFNQQEFQKSKLSRNTLTRRLLRCFLKYACEFVLDPKGPMLCYITSKDCPPYIEWDLESSLILGLNINYLGQHPFDINQFQGYKIRNVDSDNHVKDTKGTTFVWSQKQNFPIQNNLMIPKYLSPNNCAFCRVGPFHNDQQLNNHLTSWKHVKMLEHQKDWMYYLTDQDIPQDIQDQIQQKLLNYNQILLKGSYKQIRSKIKSKQISKDLKNQQNQLKMTQKTI